MWQNSHAAVVQRVENRVSKMDAPKGCPNIGLCQEVNGTSRYKAGETRRAYPVRFALINKGDCVGFQFKRIGNRSGFPVVKCLDNGAGDQASKISRPSISKLHDL